MTATDVDKQPNQVLYNKYRPKRFDEVVGQDNTISMLRDLVRTNSVPHTMIFFGDRGCGKTTSARLLAAAINCVNLGEDGEPCGVCEFCDGVFSGRATLGLREIDGASSRSIDEARRIIADSSTATAAKRKVYLIDEAHQLTNEAKIAFLKTFEEPPPGVVFILATTDPKKLPPTIRSRASMYGFSLIDDTVMHDHVKSIIAAEGIEMSDDTLAAAIEEGGGSVRDTLSIVETLRNGGEYHSSTNYVPALSQAIDKKAISEVFATINTAATDGVDMNSVALGLSGYWRDCLFALQAPDQISPRRLADVLPDAEAMRTPKILRYIEKVSAILPKMSNSPEPRLVLESSLVEMMLPPEDRSGSEAVEEMLRLLREEVAELTKLVKAAPRVSVAASSAETWPETDAPVREQADAVVVRDEDPEDEDNDDEPEDEDSFAMSDAPDPDPVTDDDPDDDPDEDDDEPDDDEADEAKQNAPDDRTIEELTASIRAGAKRHLAVRLGDDCIFEFGTKEDEGFFVVETMYPLSDKMHDELAALVKNEGYRLKHYFSKEAAS